MKAVDWGIDSGNASVAAVNSVQAAISATDAFLVHHLGKKSVGTDHREVLTLVARADSSVKRDIGKHLQRILDRKNEVEYQDREVTLADAKELQKHAHRLLGAVRQTFTD